MNWLTVPGCELRFILKDAPLRCVWCSTPQAHERPTRILWDSKHCLYCNLCVSECPTGSLAFSDNRLTFTPDTCTFCRACTDHCPSRMLHFVGQMMDMDEIMEKFLPTGSSMEMAASFSPAAIR